MEPQEQSKDRSQITIAIGTAIETTVAIEIVIGIGVTAAAR